MSDNHPVHETMHERRHGVGDALSLGRGKQLTSGRISDIGDGDLTSAQDNAGERNPRSLCLSSPSQGYQQHGLQRLNGRPHTRKWLQVWNLFRDRSRMSSQRDSKSCETV